MAGKPWKYHEEKYLREHADDGRKAIAHHLGRSPEAIKVKARELGVSLRKDGEHRGRKLGESAASVELYRRTLAQGIDPEQAVERVRNRHRLEICPNCGKKRVLSQLSGFCEPCHITALTEAVRQAIVEERELEVAMKEHAVARTESKRAREELDFEVGCPSCGSRFIAKGLPAQTRKRWKDIVCPLCGAGLRVRSK